MEGFILFGFVGALVTTIGVIFKGSFLRDSFIGKLRAEPSPKTLVLDLINRCELHRKYKEAAEACVKYYQIDPHNYVIIAKAIFYYYLSFGKGNMDGYARHILDELDKIVVEKSLFKEAEKNNETFTQSSISQIYRYYAKLQYRLGRKSEAAMYKEISRIIVEEYF